MSWWAELMGGSGRTEKRSYTQSAISSRLLYHTGKQADAVGLAALEFAAGLIGRSLATAETSGNSIAASVITPAFLQSVGRALVRRGKIVYGIEVAGGKIQLSTASFWDIEGKPQPDSWWYRLTINGPSGDQIKLFPATSVLHFRFATEPGREWRGLSSLQLADETAKLAGHLEGRLAEEISSPVGSLIPIPVDAGGGKEDDVLALLKQDIATIGGQHVFVETTANAWGEGRGAAPLGDWKARRIGAHPPDVLRALRSEVVQAVIAACGIPPGLADPRSDGTAQRESFRRFLHVCLLPLARLIEAEIATKLETEIRLSFDGLFASDLSGRARAFGSLVKGGMDIFKAAALAGLLSDE